VARQPAQGTETDASRRRGRGSILPGSEPANPVAADRILGTGRRRALPAGRAVVGGFLVAVAAVIVFAASLAGTSHPGQRWIVAARSLGPGTVIESGDLTSVTMRLSSATAALAYREPVSIEGRTLAVGLRSGELLQASMLVLSSQQPVLRPVSLAVDPVSLAGLFAGQGVDVLMTQGTGNATGVTVVVRGATLLDVVAPSSGPLATGSGGQVTIGVATLSEVEAVVAAAHTGTITLVVAEPSDGSGPGPGAAGP
jgi:hypothetical protein